MEAHLEWCIMCGRATLPGAIYCSQPCFNKDQCAPTFSSGGAENSVQPIVAQLPSNPCTSQKCKIAIHQHRHSDQQLLNAQVIWKTKLVNTTPTVPLAASYAAVAFSRRVKSSRGVLSLR